MLTQQAMQQIRIASEASLFYFSTVVLGRKWLSPVLHRDMAEFMTARGAWAHTADRRRRLELIPRDHVKTTLVKDQILHLAIQPADSNIYFPGTPGIDCRTILAGETTKNASRHLRSVEDVVEQNKLFQALWPHVRPGRKWSESEMSLQRQSNYSEVFCEALGTDSAIASRHVDWVFCDDLVTFEAWQSPTVMERVRLWFAALEPILDETENTQSRLLVTGTPWCESDVYKSIIDGDKEASAIDESQWAIYQRSVIENGVPIWPERFPLTRLRSIERTSRASGLWYYNWLCIYGSSEFSDLRPAWLQRYALRGNEIVQLTTGTNDPYATPASA